MYAAPNSQVHRLSDKEGRLQLSVPSICYNSHGVVRYDSPKVDRDAAKHQK